MAEVPALTRAGRATRRRVLGDAHADRSEGNATPFDAPFVALTTDSAWGHVWSRDTLPLRERSMLTISLLAGLGNWDDWPCTSAAASTPAPPRRT